MVSDFFNQLLYWPIALLGLVRCRWRKRLLKFSLSCWCL